MQDFRGRTKPQPVLKDEILDPLFIAVYLGRDKKSTYKDNRQRLLIETFGRFIPQSLINDRVSFRSNLNLMVNLTRSICINPFYVIITVYVFKLDSCATAI